MSLYEVNMKQSGIYVLLVLVLIFTLHIRPEVTASGNTNDCLRILDINVWSGLDYKGYFRMGEYETPALREKRYSALVSQIRQLDPDIIGIHEANKLPDYAERLARETGYEVFYHVGIGGIRLGSIGLPWNLREGDAILAKKYLNPQSAGRRQLSGGYVGNWASFHFSDATQVIAIRITFQDRPVFVFATHWHASLSDSPDILAKAKAMNDAGEMTGDEYAKVVTKIERGVAWRLSESKKTVDFIRKTAGNQIFILVGDFNAAADSREMANLLQSGMVDVYRIANPDSSGFTWDPRTNLNYKAYYMKGPDANEDSDAYEKLQDFAGEIPKRIDHIIIGPAFLMDSEGISIKSSKVVMRQIINGVHASDHYGVYAEIEAGRQKQASQSKEGPK
jgi:hypothetical protein